jgi:hypothetical protein
MVRLRSVADGKHLDDFAAWLVRESFVRCGEYNDRYERSISFSVPEPKTADIIFSVKEMVGDPDPGYLHLFAMGCGRLAGLMLIDNVRGGGVSVEIDDISMAMNELGADTINIRNILLEFPGFSNLAGIIAKVRSI